MTGTLISKKFDLLVVRLSPVGEKGAAQLAYFGKNVALIERGKRFWEGLLLVKTLTYRS